MAQRAVNSVTGIRLRGNLTLYLVILLSLVAFVALACGIKAGENRPARPAESGGEIEFHRTPITALEPTQVELTVDEGTCTPDPTDLQFLTGVRVRFSIQIPTEIRQGVSGSIEVVEGGEDVSATYSIPNFEISGVAGGQQFLGMTNVDLIIGLGSKTNFDFTPANAGTFDILCNDAKVGTLTVTEAG